jgi:hypothetical protein
MSEPCINFVTVAGWVQHFRDFGNKQIHAHRITEKDSPYGGVRVILAVPKRLKPMGDRHTIPCYMFQMGKKEFMECVRPGDMIQVTGHLRSLDYVASRDIVQDGVKVPGQRRIIQLSLVIENFIPLRRGKGPHPNAGVIFRAQGVSNVQSRASYAPSAFRPDGSLRNEDAEY